MLNDFKDDDFDSKIKNEDISVIQFSAAWCGPCKALVPVMTKLSEEYKDKAGFYYADIEDGGINTGSAAGIRGVPTVIIYKTVGVAKYCNCRDCPQPYRNHIVCGAPTLVS